METPITIAQAALETGLHRKTINDALIVGKLHGGQNMKRGTWRMLPSCLEAWIIGDECAHRREAVAA